MTYLYGCFSCFRGLFQWVQDSTYNLMFKLFAHCDSLSSYKIKRCRKLSKNCSMLDKNREIFGRYNSWRPIKSKLLDLNWFRNWSGGGMASLAPSVATSLKDINIKSCCKHYRPKTVATWVRFYITLYHITKNQLLDGNLWIFFQSKFIHESQVTVFHMEG